MAAAFQTTIEALEKELAELIGQDKIGARIDSHNKVDLHMDLRLSSLFFLSRSSSPLY